MATDAPRPSRKYDAFVSYSHSADGELAPAIQRGLHRFAKPLMKRRAIEVFRDQTGLSVNASLWTSICEAMDGSEWFVLLASPESARSEWVGHEIQRWVATKGADRILPVVTEGTWVWDATVNGFDWERSTAVHPALHGVFTSEPRHLDMTWARGEAQLTLRNGRFRDQIAELAAPIHGRAKDELEGEDVHQQKRTRRMVTGAVIALTALTATSITGGGLALVSRRTAIQERDRADQQAREAISRRLAGLVADISGADRSLPFLLAAEAYRKAPTLEAQGALAEVAVRAAEEAVGTRYVGHERGVVDVAVSSDGSRVATLDGAGRVRVFDGDAPADPEVLEGTATSIVFAGDRLAVGGDEGVVWWRGATRSGSVDLAGVAVVGAAPPGSAPGAVAAALEDGSLVVVAPDGAPATVTDASGVPDPVFVEGAAGGAVVVSNAAGRTRVVGRDGAELASWTGTAAVSDVSEDGERVTELVHEPGGGGEVPLANIRSLDGGIEATITTVEYFVSQAALFLDDGRIAVATDGGVDGAPPQVFLAPPGGGETEFVKSDLPAGLRAVAHGGGRLVFGGTDPVAPGTTLGGSDFGGDAVPSGWRPAATLSTSSRHLVVRDADGATGLLDVATAEVSTVAGLRADGWIDSGARWFLSTDGALLDLRRPEEPVATGLPRPSLGPAWSGDGSTIAYVVDAGAPNDGIAGAAMEDDTELALVSTRSGAVRKLAPGGAVCRVGCFGSDAAIALSDDGGRLLLRVGGTDPSSGATEPSTLRLFALGGAEPKEVTGRPADGPAPVAFDAEHRVFLTATGGRVVQLTEDDLAEVGSRAADPIADWAFAPGGDRIAAIRVPPAGCDIGLVNTESWSLDAVVTEYEVLSEAGCDVGLWAAWVGDTLLTSGDCLDEDACPVRRWDLDPKRLAARACRLAGRNMTRDEWDQFLPGWPYERTCEQYGAASDDPPRRPTTTRAAGASPTTVAPGATTGPPATEAPATAAPTTTSGFTGSTVAPSSGSGSLFGDLDQDSAAALYGYLQDEQRTFVGPCASAVARGNPADVCIVATTMVGDGEMIVTLAEPQSDVMWDIALSRGAGRWTAGPVDPEVYGELGE